jgi:DNA repair exonuclease SbcCD ATPase subunit
MKFIIFSDIHLSNYSGKVNPVEKISQRLVDQKSILQQLIDLAVQEGAVLLDGGDVFHCVGAVPTEALNVYSWFLKEVQKCGIKYYATQGNHDLILRKGGMQWHSVLNLFQDKQQRDKELSEMKVRFVDYDEEDVYSIKGWDVVLLHKQPACSNKYGFKHEGVDWKKVSKNNRLCFYGHFHETKKLSSTSYVIGQPMQMTQADVGEDRGCWLVNSEDWKAEFIKLDYPELQKIEKITAKEEKIEERIKATSFNDILLEWLAHENKDNSYLELIKDDLQDKIQVNKNFFKGKIQKVYVKDFLSFEEITFEFKNGFWLVLGENGVGKTTLFESILWLLFDDTTKQLSKSEVVRNRPTKQKDAYGELSLVDDKFYTIKRSVKNGVEVFCDNKNLVEGMTKIQAQEFLEKNILGFDKNTYLASCYFSQEGLITLAQLGGSETTNMVTNLLGFETYNTLHELMGTKVKEVTLQMEQLDKSSVNLNNEIWKNSEQQKNVKEQIEMFTKQQCSLKDEQLKVNQQHDEFTTLLVKIEIPTITTEEIDVSLSLLNGSKNEMVIKRNQLQEESRKIQQAQNRIEKEKIKIEAERKAIENSIANHEASFESLKENKCLYCGTVLNGDNLVKHLAEEKAEILLLRASIKGNSPELDKEMDMWYDKEAENNELISAINASQDVVEQQIRNAQEQRNITLKALTEANSRKDSLTQQIKQLEQRKSSLVNQLAQVNVETKNSQLKELESLLINLLTEQTNLQVKVLALNENKTIYEFWSVAFSNKGIRPLLLDRFVNEVNNIIHHYCYEISNGEFLVEFNPTSKTRAGLERNKLDLQVIYQDKTVPYGSLSGGEKTRANLPLCLGLNKWISKKYGIKDGLYGIVILDELFANLDVKGRENVAALLTEEGRNRSIFVIDHNPTLESYTDHILQVTKENEVTQIQEV